MDIAVAREVIAYIKVFRGDVGVHVVFCGAEKLQVNFYFRSAKDLGFGVLLSNTRSRYSARHPYTPQCVS